MWWLLLTLFWWCGTSAVPAPGSEGWICPEIHRKPFVECNCDMPHTLRCTGNRSAFKIISRELQAPRTSAVSLLDCTVQNVSSLPALLLEGVALHGLVISSGEVTSVHPNAFQGLAIPLEALGLPNNMLSSVPTLALKSLPELERLDLSENRLKILDRNSFKGLENLSFLEMSGNRLMQIAPGTFSGLPRLRVLRLRENRISLSVLSRLENLPSLEELDLAENNLKGPLCLDTFPSMPNLKDLQLSHNALSSIKINAMRGLQNLTSLSLHHNQIDVIEDHAFTFHSELITLDLSYNRIVAVSGASLAHLSKLRDLDLRHNYLRALTADLIVPLKSLKNLRLDDNEISIIAGDALQPSNVLLRLTLSENPLNCDCSLTEFAVWLFNSSVSREDKSSAVCTTPPSLENGLLYEIPKEKLLCGENEQEALMSPLADAGEAKINLKSFNYDGRRISLVWNVRDTIAPFSCDAIFVYEEEGANEVLLESTPLRCNSSNLVNPNILEMSVPPAIHLQQGHLYRYCIVLLGNRQSNDDSALMLGCSDIIPLVENAQVQLMHTANYSLKLPKVIAIQANFSGFDTLSIDVNVFPPNSKCALNVAILEQGTLLSQRQLNCSDPKYVFIGLNAGPYKVCANIVRANLSMDSGLKPRCIGVIRSETRGFSVLDVVFVSIFLVLCVMVIVLIWGVRKILLKPKAGTHQCFMHQDEVHQRQHNRYMKLQATTNL